MTENVYNIFRSCFPVLDLSPENFSELFGTENAESRIITEENGKGFAIVNKDVIRLLCVSPDEQGRGKGSALLTECEEIIKKSGYDKSRLGEQGMAFMGAPAERESGGRLPAFFEKRGYISTGRSTELSMKCSEIDKNLIPVPAVETEFRFLTPAEHDRLIPAVASVEEKWCRYFDPADEVFAGIVNGEIASFCITDVNCTTLISRRDANIGSVGCVGTVPHMRRKSIGLAMVGKASAILAERGCTDIYIHYTHLADWYGKLGFKPLICFEWGEKKL